MLFYVIFSKTCRCTVPFAWHSQLTSPQTSPVFTVLLLEQFLEPQMYTNQIFHIFLLVSLVITLITFCSEVLRIPSEMSKVFFCIPSFSSEKKYPFIYKKIYGIGSGIRAKNYLNFWKCRCTIQIHQREILKL